MAIFNRSKEKWIPTKPLNKTTKNRTVYFERDTTSAISPKPFELNKRLWMWLDSQLIDSTSVYDLYYLNSDSNDHEVSTMTHEGVDPRLVPMRSTRFLQKAISFSYTGEQGYIESSAFNLDKMLLTWDGTQYLSVDSALWISFWVKTPDRHPGVEPTQGQSIGGFVKQLPDNQDNDSANGIDDPGELKPTLAFYITGDGFVSLRGHTSPPGVPVPATIDTNISFAETKTARKLLEGEWNYVSICIPTEARAANNSALTQISFLI